MGYSISVQAPTEKLQTKMYEFLCDNWNYLTNQKEYDFSAGTALRICKGRNANSATEGISYAPDDVSNLVGFDYSSWITDEERFHVYRVMDWMREVLGAPGYYYDSEFETNPLKTREEVEREPKNYLMMASFMRTEKYIKGIIDFVFNDVERLKNLWED